MKTFYLITAMDKMNGNIYYPDPCLFETEKEADKYIELQEGKTISFMRKKVRAGKMNLRLKK